MGPACVAAILEPRVVILDREWGPEVGVVEVPCPATVGMEFEHDGRRWRVMAQREHSRVLFARESVCPDLEA